MKLYQTPGGTWAGSEKDWKAAMKAEGSDPKAMKRNTVDVPTSKADLMEFLTFNNVNVLNPSASTKQVVPAVDNPPAPPPGDTVVKPLDTSASATLSRIDNPGVDVDGIVETICNSSGHALKRFAGAVAMAFQQLAA